MDRMDPAIQEMKRALAKRGADMVDALVEAEGAYTRDGNAQNEDRAQLAWDTLRGFLADLIGVNALPLS